MVRRALDGVYLASGYLSGFFLVGIAVTILAQVVGRLLGFAVDMTEISGFCLAASTFLGLAYTFHSGSHIRISIVIRNLGGRPRRAIELICCGTGAVMLAYFSYYAGDLFWQFYKFGDISRGLYAVPFWFPQSGMVVGLLVLTVGFMDEFVRVARGLVPSYEAAEAEPGDESRA